MIEGSSQERPIHPAANAATDFPATPVVKSSELWLDTPFALVDSGRYAIGWQCWQERKGGPKFVTLRRGSLGTFKIVEKYPLTDLGWKQAWSAFVSLDPVSATKTRIVLEQRTDAEAGFVELSKLDASSLAFLREVVFLGGYIPHAELTPRSPYDVRFHEDRLALYLPGALRELTELAYSHVEHIDVGGPGLVKSGGGFVGGGFGAVGAAEGMAVAAILNALTTRTTVKTVLRIQATDAELFFLHPRTEPEPLRIELSRALGAVREAQRQSGVSGEELHPVSVVDELSKLAALLERGLLTRDEFDHLKGRLIEGRG